MPRSSKSGLVLKSTPVICVCVINNRGGVVLREDYDRASKDYWESRVGLVGFAFEDQIEERGIYLPVEPIFSFNLDDMRQRQEFDVILYKCFVEKAIFQVPPPPKPANAHADWPTHYNPFFARVRELGYTV